MRKLPHRLLLLLVKYLPVLLAISEFVADILLYIGVSITTMGGLVGTSVVTLIPMYILSYAFKFCKYHRMILHYIAVHKVVFLIDSIVIIPTASAGFLIGVFILAAIFSALAIYNYLKYGNRVNT